MSEEIVVYVDADLEEITPEFLENRHEDIQHITRLLESDEIAEIQRLGHSMKGSGGGYGFHEVTRIGDALEQAAKQGDKMKIRELNERLAQYLSVVKVVYQEMG
ncbi:MAG: Hpt domain-containing protein [bacterium]